MKQTILTTLFLLATFTLATAQENKTATSEELQPWIAKDKATTRAGEDERVLFVIVTVKADQKEAYDTWIRDVLYDALYKSESEMIKAQLNATRWLEPVRPNRDSTWTYSWLMDPMIPNTDYDIEKFLKLEYGEELAAKHWADYRSFLAKREDIFMLKQTGM